MWHIYCCILNWFKAIQFLFYKIGHARKSDFSIYLTLNLHKDLTKKGTIVQVPSGKLTIEKAIEQLNAKNDVEALRLFDQVISEGSNIPGINYGKAVAFARIGRVNEAIDLLEKMLSRIPNYGIAKNLLDELKPCSSSGFREKETSLASSQKAKALSQWLPSTLYSDDIFITSYPKSGNTWLRFLLANLLKRQDEEIDFHTVHNYVPEVGKHEEIIKTLKRPRVMKSHAPFMHEYPKVIYLIRDGRDVYVSYYFHRLKQLSPDCTFREFLERQDHYPCTWGEHVANWLFKEPTSKILVVRYEDLVRNCLKQLKRILDFLGMERTEDQFKLAEEASSFTNMQRIESEKGRLYKNEGPEVFMRSGKSGDWKDFFRQEEKMIFKSREGQFLVKLGYETENNW